MEEEQFHEFMNYKFDCTNKEELKTLIDKFLPLVNQLEKVIFNMANNFETNSIKGKAATLVYLDKVVFEALLQKYNECLAKAKEISETNNVIGGAKPLPKYVDPFDDNQKVQLDAPKYVQRVKNRLQKICSALKGDSKVKSIDTDGGCFIATATMGYIDDPVVCDLRQFRDECLLRYWFGRKVISLYYRFSPPLARIIARDYILRKLSFLLIIQPAHKLIMSIRNNKDGSHLKY